MYIHEKIDAYIEQNSHFKNGLVQLRELCCSTELVETVKWGAPVYTLNGKNVMGLAAFKNHFGLWFFNGVFLKDPHNLLINAQKNKTKALRQLRFTSEDDLNIKQVQDFIKEAIENQRMGKILKPAKTKKPLTLPLELRQLLRSDKLINDAYKALTPGRQREYSDYIESAKREITKRNRIEKIKPLILKGKGLNDAYKSC